MKFLVTGATGFIGRNLVEELSKKYPESKIFCIVRFSSNKKILYSFNVKFIFADITDFNTLKNINERFDVIFHCAGYVGNNNKKLHKINVVGTENICKLALKLNIDKLIYTSSIAVISGNLEVPLTKDLPYKATNQYGESKIKAEEITLSYRKRGLKIAIIRPCMVYGEGEPHLMPKLIFLLKHHLLPFVNKYNNKLHLVYVKNVVDCLIFAIYNDEMFKSTYIIADKEVLSINEVLTIISQAVGSKPPYRFSPFLISFLKNIPILRKKINAIFKNREYDISKLLSIGYTPSYSARESLFNSCHYF